MSETLTDREKLELLEQWLWLERELQRVFREWSDLNARSTAVKDKLLGAAPEDPA